MLSQTEIRSEKKMTADTNGTSVPSRSQHILQDILAKAEVGFGGPQPWDIQVHNTRFFDRLLSDGFLGVGESYMEGWWDCPSIDQLVDRCIRADLEKEFQTFKMVWAGIKAKFLNLQRKAKAFHNAGHHYNIGNDLFQRMLGKRLMYSCAYWKDAHTLDEAQEAKLKLSCEKLELASGMRVLDIGCGWGGFAHYAAEKYGVKVVGITVSEQQAALAKKICQDLPVEIRLQDYRDINEKFDRIISIGMFEHVGAKNYRTYMKVAHRCLKPGGYFLLHTIGQNKTGTIINSWFHRYIFPNAQIPSPQQIATASEGIFLMEDWHSFGPDYDKTLMAWHENFESHWPELKGRYDETFHRMWRFYLLSCAGAFRARENQLWQVLFSKDGKRPRRIR